MSLGFKRLMGGCVGPRWVRKISPPPGFESWTVQHVEIRYTDCVIQAIALFVIISIENMADGRKCEAGATWHKLSSAVRS